MSPSALLAGAALLIWVVPAGVLTAGFARRDSTLWADDVVALAASTGLFVIGSGSLLLGRFGVLSGEVFWLVGVVLALAFVLGRALVSRSRRLTIRGWKEWGRVLLPIAVALVAAAPHLSSIVVRPDALPGSTPWYYWDLARQVGREEAFPETSLEWGVEVPFLDDYPAFTATTAGLAAASSEPGLLMAAHLMRVLSAVGAGFGIWYLCRSWGADRFASAAAVFLLLALGVYAVKMSSYRPEAAGYVYMFLSAALGRRWLVTRQRVFLVGSVTAFVTLGLVHGVAWVVGAIFLIATCLSWALRSPGPGRSRLAASGMLLLIAFVTWAAMAAALQGRLSESEKLATLPTIAADGTDPTWEFVVQIGGPGDVPPPSNAELVSRALGDGIAGVSTGRAFLIIAGLVLLIGSLRAWRADSESKNLVSTVALFIAGTAIVASFFMLGWDTYVPRRTGAVRIVQIGLFTGPLLVAIGWRHHVVERFPKWSMVLLAAAATVWGFAAGDIYASSARQMPDRDSIDLQRELTIDGTALVNGYTEGYLAVNLGVRSLQEGRAPYTDDFLLDLATRRLRTAREFFADPGSASIDLAGVDFVIVMKEDWSMGSPSVLSADTEGLVSHPGLSVLADNHWWLVLETTD